MSRIKGKDTGPERQISMFLAELGYVWDAHSKDLPGKPDLVFRHQKIAVFVDGDFWHGWKFEQWRDKLSEKWEAKIAATRLRDARNRRRLRRMGWKVIRVWEHQIKRDCGKCVAKIVGIIDQNGHG